jgi:hypothetical protein
MLWQEQWAALSGRIGNLAEAARLLLSTLRIQSEDPYKVTTRISEQARAIVDELRGFQAAFSSTIPPLARDALQRFLEKDGPRIADAGVPGVEGIKLRLPLLVALRSELEYHLAGFEERARRRVERAFIHLQRSIVVDETFREKWVTAYDKNEVRCEQLGAVHLLQHGIWAFKVDAKGARTDLVFREPLSEVDEIVRSADALVLTEWKLVRSGNDPRDVAAAARNQAMHYASGALASLELTQYRYIVLVSKDWLPRLDDVAVDRIVYRQVNLAVSPSSPSKAWT